MARYASLAIIICLPTLVGAAPPARYLARLADGTWIEGNQLTNWQSGQTSPQLEGRRLLGPKNKTPFLWLRDRTLFPQRPPASFVTTTTGDIVPGEVMQYVPAGSPRWDAQPAHLVVAPRFKLQPRKTLLEPKVRIGLRWVRRIVWQRRAREYRPGTVYFRDGRQQSFRAFRFSTEGLRLLTNRGAKSVKFAEVAELHLPAQDPWNALLDELAVLDVTANTRLIQYETTTGLRATSSLNRFFATGSGNIEQWVHGLQPAWSLDVLWLPNSDIWMRRSFSANEVPLPRILPSRFQSRSMISGAAIPLQTNRSVLGAALRSGGKEFGWGFGVHSNSELSFQLPSYATAVTTAVGLDRAAGAKGGCVRASVLVEFNGKSSKLFQSSHLVGHRAIAKCPPTPLPSAKTRVLRLHVDAAHQGRPAGADPFDIRDMTNWLAPLVQLDQGFLAQELPRRLSGLSPVWSQWSVQVQSRDPFGPPQPVVGSWFLDKAATALETHRFRWHVQGQFWTMVKKQLLLPQHRWLLIRATRYQTRGSAPHLQVRLNQQLLADITIPKHTRVPVPIAIPLHSVQTGQPQEVHLELTLSAAQSAAAVHFYDIQFANQSPHLHELLEDSGKLETVAADAQQGQTTTSQAPTWVSTDRYAGKRSLRCLAGTGTTYRLRFPPKPIRSSPKLGEFRYLRLAFRKRGGGKWGMRLKHVDELVRPTDYESGRGKPIFGRSKSMVTSVLPDEWIVVTRDLYRDFGTLDLEGLEFHIPDGHSLHIDHVYLAQSTNHFGSISAKRISANQLTRVQAQLVKTRKLASPAVVTITTPTGNQCTGVFVSSNGEILAPANLVIAHKQVQVIFGRSRKLSATVLGCDRSTNLALLRVQTNNKKALPSVDVVRSVSLSGQSQLLRADRKPGQEVVWQPVSMSHRVQNIISVAPQGDSLGLLFTLKGQLIGMPMGRGPFGAMRYVVFGALSQKLAQMRKSVRIGSWVEGSQPWAGLQFQAQTGCTVLSAAASTQLKPNDVLMSVNGKAVPGPRACVTALSQLDPGSVATIVLRRKAKQQTVRVKLPVGPNRQ